MSLIALSNIIPPLVFAYFTNRTSSTYFSILISIEIVFACSDSIGSFLTSSFSFQFAACASDLKLRTSCDRLDTVTYVYKWPCLHQGFNARILGVKIERRIKETMQFSISKAKAFAIITIVLLMTSVTLMAAPITALAQTQYTNEQSGGSLPLPTGLLLTIQLL